jgi:hypothetical protein
MEKLHLTSVKVMTIPEGVGVPMVASHIDEQKKFNPPPALEPSLKAMFDELAKWAGALKTLRTGA